MVYHARFLGAVVLTLWIIARPASAAKDPAFQRLPAEGKATTMALTEDGAHLVVAHEKANRLTVWDVRTGQAVKLIDCPAPRHIICRGEQVFVANYGKGTITVYSQKLDYKSDGTLPTGDPEPYFLSASQGKYFDGKILVTCRKLEPRAIYLVDVSTRQRRRIREIRTTKFRRAHVDYAGRFVMEDGIAGNFYRDDGTGTYRWQDYLEGGLPLCYGGGDQTGAASQTHAGAHWIIGSHFGQGIPPLTCESLTKAAGLMDHREPLGYTILAPTPLAKVGKLRAWRLDDRQTPLGERDLGLVEELFMHGERGWTLDDEHVPAFHPSLAVTLDGVLHLFVICHAGKGAGVYRCAVKGFIATPSGNDFPTQVVSGEQLRFDLRNSVTSPAVWSLAMGPSTAVVSSEGMLTWTPGPNERGPQSLRIIAKHGDNLQAFRFKTEVVKSLSQGPARPSISGGEPGRHIVDPIEPHFVNSLDGQSILVLQGSVLRFLDEEGMVEYRREHLPDAYLSLFERPDYYVALGMHHVDLLDKATLQIKKKISLPERFTYGYDLAIHPKKPRCFVSASDNAYIQGPTRTAHGSYVLQIDEEKGTCALSNNMHGRWLAMDPQGRFLYTLEGCEINAAWLTHRNRRRTEDHDGEIFSVCSVGTGSLRVLQSVKSGHCNGKGLRIAPDGREVAYIRDWTTTLQEKGSQKGIGGYAAGKIKDARVIYRGQWLVDLSYHSRLNLVATLASGVQFYDGKGQALGSRLEDPAQWNLTDPSRIHFTPGGKRILGYGIGETKGEVRSRRPEVRSFPLKLTDAELARLSPKEIPR